MVSNQLILNLWEDYTTKVGFLPPSGPSTASRSSVINLYFLVNIIPLIAKADTMTPDECDDFKKEILREIETHKINIYEFPDHDDEEENRFVPSWEPN